MDWDVTPPAEEIPSLLARHDPNLVVGPGGSYYAGLQVYLALNQYAGPMRNKLVRQAANHAVDKNAIVAAYGGPRIAAPTSQVVLPGNVGYLQHYDRYPDNSGSGDAARSKALLAKAGYPHGVAIKLLSSTADPGLRVAEALRSSLTAGGFRVTLVPVEQHDLYAKYLLRPDTARGDAWDVAPAGWAPDWFGDNGRSVIQPLFSSPGYGSSDYSGYSSRELEGYLSKALTAASRAEAAIYWQRANARIMDDAAAVPVEIQKYTAYHSARVRGCVFFFWDLNCDPTNVWLSD
jgi:ABC-type transport system substrate-binding protein